MIGLHRGKSSLIGGRWFESKFGASSSKKASMNNGWPLFMRRIRAHSWEVQVLPRENPATGSRRVGRSRLMGGDCTGIDGRIE